MVARTPGTAKMTCSNCLKYQFRSLTRFHTFKMPSTLYKYIQVQKFWYWLPSASQHKIRKTRLALEQDVKRNKAKTEGRLNTWTAFYIFIGDMFTEWWGSRLQSNMGYVSIRVERLQSLGLHLLSTSLVFDMKAWCATFPSPRRDCRWLTETQLCNLSITPRGFNLKGMEKKEDLKNHSILHL